MAKSTRLTPLVVLFALGLPAAACVYKTRHTEEEVRAAIGEASIIGATPDQAITMLRRVRLKGGDSIEVGAYQPRRRRIEASVSPARRTLFTQWAIDVTVRFDSTQKATSLDVSYSAINPM